MSAIIIETFTGKIKAISIRNSENIETFERIKLQAEIMQSFDKGKMEICREIAGNLELSVDKVYRVLSHVYEMQF
jgi:hypothetical protein